MTFGLCTYDEHVISGGPPSLLPRWLPATSFDALVRGGPLGIARNILHRHDTVRVTEQVRIMIARHGGSLGVQIA